MSDQESSDKPPEKKLPRLKVPGSSDKAEDQPEKVEPELGKLSEKDSETTKLELSEVMPEEKDASKNATMRVDIDEAVLPGSEPGQMFGDTQPVEGGKSADETIQVDVDGETAEIGKSGQVKSDTTKLSIDDAIEGKDTSKISLEQEEESPSLGATMPVSDLGITSEIKSDTTKLNLDEAIAERETKSPADTRPIQSSPASKDEEAEEGIQETGKMDDDFFKSATMPIEGANEEAEEGIQETGKMDDDFFKSATMPIEGASEEAEEGIQETGKMDDDFFKSATMPIDTGEEAKPSTPEGEKKADDDFFKSATVPIKDLPDGDATGSKNLTKDIDTGEAGGPAAAAGTGGRPRTIKIKKPSAKQLDTVKLQKSPLTAEEASPSESTETVPPDRKKTVKLKRQEGSTSAGKTLAVSRPPAGAASTRRAGASVNADEAVMGGQEMPGAVFSILAMLSFFLTCTALYFLYTAYTTIAG